MRPWGRNDTYTFEFPTGTVLPTTILKNQASLRDLTTDVEDNQNANPAINGQQITITQKLNNGTDFQAGHLIQVVLGSAAKPSSLIQNPATQSTNYTVDVWSNVETTHVTSSPYTIVVAEMTPATVTLGNTTVSTATSYTFEFNTSQQVNEDGWFHIIFGGATTLQATDDADWRINGNTLDNNEAVRSGQRISLRVPGGVSIAPGAVTISHVQNYDITNPATPSSQYTVDIFTSTDQVGTDTLDSQTTSETYTVTSSTAPTMGDVTVSPSTVSSQAYYKIAWSGLIGTMVSGDTLTYTFPSGTVIPSTIAASACTLTHDGTPVTIGSVVANSSERTVAVILGGSLGPAGADTLAIAASAGIANPSTASSYTVDMRTTLQPNDGTSNTYSISTSSTMTQASVTPSPNTFSTVAQYRVSFALGDAGALSVGQRIRLQFPNDTQVPSSIGKATTTVNGVTSQSVLTDAVNRYVWVYVDQALSNNAAVEIIISSSAGIKNPTSVGSYTLHARTQVETGGYSYSYSIIESQVTSATITPASNQPLVGTSYDIDFNVGAGGALSAGSSTITIDFHDSVTVSSSLAASDISVNSTTVTLAPTVNTSTSTITFTTPVSISGGGAVSISIGAGITNPSIGSYTADIYTSIESTPVTSEAFSINSGTSVSDVTVSLDTYTTSAAAVWTVNFTANNSMAIIQSNDRHYIYVDLPDACDASAITQTDVSVTANAVSRTITDVSYDGSSELVTIEISQTIAADAAVVVTIGGTNTVTNPAAAKGTYYVKVHTSADANPTTSGNITISTTTNLTSVNIEPSPTTTNTIAGYSITGTLAANATMAAGEDTFFVRFPGGSTIPSTIATSYVTVNGSNANEVIVEQTVTDTLIKIITPVAISASSSPTISISSSAGIRNPGTAKSYPYTLSTNVQPGEVTDNVTIDAITDVSPASVTPSPTTAGELAQYTISFTMGGTALAANDVITVVFPDNTQVPSSISTSSLTLKEDDVAQSLLSISTTPASRTVAITLNEAVSAGASMNLVFGTAAGLYNPTTAGNSYTLSVSATNNGSATSNAYTITASKVSAATVTPSPSTQSTAAQYTVDFNVGTAGALTAGASSITITFPTGTTVPSFISASDVSVNGTSVTTSPSISDRVVTLTSPVTVAASAAVTVVFDVAAGLENPSIVSTGYTVKVKTSKETTEVTSLSYSITRGSDVSSIYVTLGTTTASQTSAYAIKFTTGTSGMAVNDSIYIVFPSGTTVPASISLDSVTVAGTAASLVETTPGTRTVLIRSAVSKSASDTCTVRFLASTSAEALTNPSAASTYTLTARVGLNATPVTSFKYSVTTTNQLTGVTISPDPNTTSTAASYTVVATTSADGAMVEGDSIIVVFPSGTTVPSSIATSNVSVNGTPLTRAPVINQAARRVAVSIPVSVSGSTQFTLVFGEAAGLVNPTTATDYTADVSTNIQTIAKTSDPYTIATATTVSPASITVSPTTVTLTAQYALSFTLGTTALSSGDTIKITFPSGTTVPATIDTAAISVKDDGVLVPKAATSGVTTVSASRIIMIRVGAAINASSVIGVTIKTTAAVKNPSTAGNGYTLNVAVTGNGSATSNTYSITASTVTTANVTPSPTTESTAAQYTVAFSTGAAGALTAGSSTISVTFPAGTTVPSTMVANNVTVNGTPLSLAPTSNSSTRKVTLTTPVNVNASSSVSVVFAASVGITNPADGSKLLCDGGHKQRGYGSSVELLYDHFGLGRQCGECRIGNFHGEFDKFVYHLVHHRIRRDCQWGLALCEVPNRDDDSGDVLPPRTHCWRESPRAR